MHGLTRTSVIACIVTACGVVAQSLSSAGYLPTVVQLLALLAAFLIAIASFLIVQKKAVKWTIVPTTYSARDSL
jgi:hypothetical protein